MIPQKRGHTLPPACSLLILYMLLLLPLPPGSVPHFFLSFSHSPINSPSCLLCLALPLSTPPLVFTASSLMFYFSSALHLCDSHFPPLLFPLHLSHHFLASFQLCSFHSQYPLSPNLLFSPSSHSGSLLFFCCSCATLKTMDYRWRRREGGCS